MKTIAIASDHTGYQLKLKIIEYLDSIKIQYKDLGPKSSDAIVDYPDSAEMVLECFLNEEANIGILICATGVGMSIAANRRSGIRAALCTNKFMAERARAHNDANVLVFGSEVTDSKEAISILDTFLEVGFEGGRHLVRLEKIN